jgi:hypothetical protein
MMRALLAAVLASAILVGVHLAAGGAGYEPAPTPDACVATLPEGGEGLTATAQRVGLTALNRSACELGVGREELLLSLAGERELDLDADRRNEAFKSGIRDAIDAEEAAGRLGATEAFLLRGGLEFLPVDAILDRLFAG